MIRPLHNQLLIRPLLDNKVSPDSAVIIPDSAQKSTLQSADGKTRLNFVTAEVIAVGPGRKRVDGDLLPEMLSLLRGFAADMDADEAAAFHSMNCTRAANLLTRAESAELIPVDVKPGDTILYHPSVKNFDAHRAVDVDGVEHFIIGEHSLLAVVE